MDCEGCVRRVRKSVEGMRGVTKVEVEPKKHKLTVTGYVDPDKVLRRVRYRTGKKAEFWPYVPGSRWIILYVRGVYDKKVRPDTSAMRMITRRHQALRGRAPLKSTILLPLVMKILRRA
ncbi:Heavy metal-associated isoprenylated plant protein 26 [Datura stramonium]|uniref:Heavy metal-associated isoprenylated plant protein 26 n=1 Tax=Datura stramonium TaxID=4076 RepID=A0ABS8UVK7_DATST|nr:Heavy metal-associated isoprenylated plant protein 26 [Datura stramonium]